MDKTYCEWCEKVEVEPSVSLCSNECEEELEFSRAEAKADLLYEQMRERD